MKALVYVQHLLGIGHVRRTAAVVRSLAQAGVEVTVAQGGRPVPDADFGAARVVQLPPARVADASFRPILDESGRPVDDAWRARRAAALLGLEQRLRPDVLVVESFPFGRGAFRFELLPLIEAAAGRSPPARIVSSVRDILVAKDPARLAAMAELAARWFDLILVHGDPRFLPFDATFPHAGRLSGRLRYTGYVAGPRPPDARGSDGADEILVSAGGGAVGGPLLHAALEAARAGAGGGRKWRLLAGAEMPEATRAALVAAAPAHVVVERARPDFPDLLSRCAVSVSQAGYNTVMDLMAARCRSVLVPFSEGGETEQEVRARLLARRGLATLVEEARLDPATLAAAVDRALEAPPPPGSGFRMNGAAVAARLIVSLVRRQPMPASRSGAPHPGTGKEIAENARLAGSG